MDDTKIKTEEKLEETQESPETTAEKATTKVEAEAEETLEKTRVEKPESTEEDELVPEDSSKTAADIIANLPGKWYVVHTYSGHENKVEATLKQRVKALGFDDRIFEVLVPTQEKIEVREGKKYTLKEKIFPGYILVNMNVDNESWYLVRSTAGVTGFVGMGNKPTPLDPREVKTILKFAEAEAPTYKASFTLGEAVKITDGPFSDFLGTVDAIDEAKGKVKVLVSIFGRETPVELDFLQVSKL